MCNADVCFVLTQQQRICWCCLWLFFLFSFLRLGLSCLFRLLLNNFDKFSIEQLWISDLHFCVKTQPYQVFHTHKRILYFFRLILLFRQFREHDYICWWYTHVANFLAGFRSRAVSDRIDFFVEHSNDQCPHRHYIVLAHSDLCHKFQEPSTFLNPFLSNNFFH